MTHPSGEGQRQIVDNWGVVMAQMEPGQDGYSELATVTKDLLERVMSYQGKDRICEK